ncbi:hypothetical protein NHF46_11700 [Arthrobacter alpinus]|nr:hypothetical protein [Arthrobacter alpinus]
MAIAVTTFSAWHTGRTWHTHRTTATLLGITTVLTVAALTMAMLATPYLYTHTHTGYTLVETLTLTHSSACTAPLIYALFHLALSTHATLTGYQTTKNND